MKFIPSPKHLYPSFLLLLSTFFLLLLPQRASLSRQEPPVSLSMPTPLVRIVLTRFMGAKTLTLQADPGARITGEEGNVLTAGTGPFIVNLTDKAATLSDARGRKWGTILESTALRMQGEDTETRVSVGRMGSKVFAYRGSLEVRLSKGRLTVINELALEDYLRSVVSSEMGAKAPMEALKAQSIAARTFALYRILSRRNAEDFDLRDDTEAQVYNGADAERPTSDQAVQATTGQILTQAGKPVPAFYCADCGGITAPGSNENDFPRSAPDDDAHGPLDNPRPPAWTLHYTPDALQRLLSKQSTLRVSGKLAAIETTERDSSGRVRRLKLTYQTPSSPEKEEAKTQSDAPIPPNSGGFSSPEREGGEAHLHGQSVESKATKANTAILPFRGGQGGETREITGNTLRTLLGLNTLRSTKFTIKQDAGGEFMITGRGWGHGRGLCQTGAMTLAAPPLSKNYRAILNRYYAGAELTVVQYDE